MLPDLKEDGKKPVQNASTESGQGRECSRMLGTGNFPDFLGKNPVSGKWHLGRQSSICSHCQTNAGTMLPDLNIDMEHISLISERTNES